MKVLIQGTERRCTLEASEKRAIDKAEAVLRIFGAETADADAVAAADAIVKFVSQRSS